MDRQYQLVFMPSSIFQHGTVEIMWRTYTLYAKGCNQCVHAKLRMNTLHVTAPKMAFGLKCAFNKIIFADSVQLCFKSTTAVCHA